MPLGYREHDDDDDDADDIVSATPSLPRSIRMCPGSSEGNGAKRPADVSPAGQGWANAALVSDLQERE